MATHQERINKLRSSMAIDLAMARLHRKGKTLQEIGDMYGGISRERVRQRIKRAKQEQRSA